MSNYGMIISIIKVFNKSIDIPCSIRIFLIGVSCFIRILMEDIWKLSEDLNI